MVGIDVNEELVEIGNQFSTELSGKTLLNKVDLERFYDEIASTKKKVVCALGVIEHLLEPNLLLKRLRKAMLNIYTILYRCSLFPPFLRLLFLKNFPGSCQVVIHICLLRVYSKIT